jgi:two-component system alkaline phosphatase synthesis response regulator PhoP
MKRLLVVEDEEHIANVLKFNLEAEGYAVDVEDNGEAVLHRLTRESNDIDLILLDVMLPGLDGFETVERLRAAGSFVPVMMLTARGHTDDVLRGFELGADDYLPKPFDLSILLARIQGLLRRKTWLEKDSTIEQAEELDEYRFSDRHIEFSRQVMKRDGAEHPLTLMETTLLRHLVRREGQAVSRKALLEEVWGVRHDTDTRTIDNFISRLRRAIEDEPSSPQHLQTVRGVGYRFVAQPTGKK